MNTSYTTGSIPKYLIQLSLPLIAGNILQQLYNTLDAVVISRYASYEEFASIGIASTVMNVYLFAIIGSCTGLSILLAQAYGASDQSLFKKYFGLGTKYGFLFFTSFGMIAACFNPTLLSWIQTPTSLQAYTHQYLFIVLMGLCITFLYNLLAACLRAIGQARIALIALFISVTMNLGFDLYFVRFLHMGIAGTAIATLLAQFIATVFCWQYLRKKQPSFLFSREDTKMDTHLLAHMAKLCSVTAIHQVSLCLGRLLVQTTINTTTTAQIAAYTATSRIEAFANSFGDSGSAATSIVAAQNYGANNAKRVKQCFWYSFALLFCLGIASSILLYVTRYTTLSLVLSNAPSETIESAAMYLQWISLFYLFCFTGNTFAGYFEGVGKASIPFIGAISHMSLRVILCFIFVPTYGLQAVALATGLGWILVNLFWSVCVYRYHAYNKGKKETLHEPIVIQMDTTT